MYYVFLCCPHVALAVSVTCRNSNVSFDVLCMSVWMFGDNVCVLNTYDAGVMTMFFPSCQSHLGWQCACNAYCDTRFLSIWTQCCVLPYRSPKLFYAPGENKLGHFTKLAIPCVSHPSLGHSAPTEPMWSGPKCPGLDRCSCFRGISHTSLCM